MRENKRLEYKENMESGTFLKTISAYANYGGGKIIFGIADDGTVKGISKPEEACLNLENKINDSIKPVPEYSDTAKHREALQVALKEKGIPSMVYYPVPLQAQDAYKWMARTPGSMETAARLSNCVLSLPIHTEMTVEEQEYIIDVLVKELENRKI